MKLKTYFNATLLCLATSLFAACAGDNLADSENNKGKQPIEEVKGVHFSIDSPKASAKLRVTLNEDGTTVTAKTRTVIKHTIGNGADAYWSANDKLWVKDKNGNWKQSIATYVYDEGRRATFIMPGSENDYNDNCQVAYCSADLTDSSVSMFAPDGIGNGYPVTHISYEQNQTTPNDFSKAGEWGDCGVGTAKKKTNKFDFTLDHSATYLCLLPRCENATLGQNIELTNIQIKADNPMQMADIASNIFELHDDGTIHYPNDNPASFGNPSSMITATVANFPLTNTTTSLETNACYFVLRPALHDFTITYTIKDKVTGVEAQIKKQVNGVNCKPGEINDFTANLSLRNQPMYYTWDSENNIGNLKYDSSSPTTLSANSATIYPFGFGDANVPGTTAHEDPTASPTNPKRIDATHTYMNGVPNVNEMMWYAYKGDARWVNQGSVIAVFGNLVRTAGVWLKKKTKILADEHITEAYMRDGFALGGGAYTDYRINPINGTAPKVSVGTSLPPNLDDYFFVPALGYYTHYGNSWYGIFDPEGCYWTSSGTPTGPGVAYGLYFSQTGISIKENYVYNPYCVLPFE